MKSCNHRRRRDRRLCRREARARRRGRDVHRARREPRGDPRERHQARSRHDGTEQVARNVRATNDYDEAGPQDLVILAMKAHQVEAVAARRAEAVRRRTRSVVTMQNGIPYWYFHAHGGALDGHAACTSVDPTGVVGACIPPSACIGCVVYPASELVAPGVVQHIEGDRFPLGELDGSHQRARAAHRGRVHARRLQGAGARRHPLPRSGSSCGAT